MSLTPTSSPEFPLSEGEAALGRMAGGVAHAFTDLVTAISAATAALEATPLSEEARTQAVASLRQAVRRTERLLDRLQTVGRTTAPLAAPLDLSAVIRDSEAEWRQLAGPDVGLTVDVPSDPVEVIGEWLLLSEACTELVRNSLAAMPFGGALLVQLLPLSDVARTLATWPEVRGRRGVILRVRDTGVGIDPADLPVLFEPFGTRRGTGGLGLPLVRAIARQHRGDVRVQAADGGGTIVEMFLPVPRADRVVGHISGEFAAIPSSTGAAVLVVDDEDAVRSAIVRVLRRAGYEVFAVTGPGEALALAASHQGVLDLVLTDIAMPDMDGLELARRLRELRPGLAIIPMSGHAADVSESRWRHVDPKRLLAKPFTAEALLAAVHDALASKPADG